MYRYGLAKLESIKCDTIDKFKGRYKKLNKIFYKYMYLFKKLFIIIVDPILVKFFLLFTMVSAPFIPQPRDHLHVPIADIYSSLSLLLSLSYFKSQVCFSGIFILRLLIPYNRSVTNYLRLC